MHQRGINCPMGCDLETNGNQVLVNDEWQDRRRRANPKQQVQRLVKRRWV